MSQTQRRGLDAFAQPISVADENTRGEFLSRVAVWMSGGTLLALMTGVISAFVVASVPPLQNRFVMMAVIFGGMFIVNSVAAPMVAGTNKVGGFLLGMIAEGATLGYLLLAAVGVSAEAFADTPGGPFIILGQAGGLTALTMASMSVYLWTQPRDLSLIRAGLSVLFIPMLALMVLTFVFPVGGVMGLMLSGAFVLISGASLLYTLNQVLHNMNANQHAEAAYQLTISTLVLFWNLTVLLMKLSRRD